MSGATRDIARNRSSNPEGGGDQIGCEARGWHRSQYHVDGSKLYTAGDIASLVPGSTIRWALDFRLKAAGFYGARIGDSGVAQHPLKTFCFVP